MMILPIVKKKGKVKELKGNLGQNLILGFTLEQIHVIFATLYWKLKSKSCYILFLYLNYLS